MATLKVTKLNCLEETDEVGSDDPYLVVFIGRTVNPALVVRGPENFWNNMETGNVRNTEVTLDTAYDGNDLTVVAMMEKDNSRDIAGVKQARVRTHLAEVWQNWGPTGIDLPRPQLEVKMTLEMLMTLAKYRDNDDIVGMPQVLNLATTSSRSLRFIGDGGHYKVWFRKA